MTEIALQRVDRRTLAEDGSCRFAFGYVSPLRTGAMAADEADRRRVEARVLQGQAQSDLHRLRLRKRGVVAVRVRGKADDLGVDVRSAGKRVLALLEDQRGRAFADYQPVTIAVKGPWARVGPIVAGRGGKHGVEDCGG